MIKIIVFILTLISYPVYADKTLDKLPVIQSMDMNGFKEISKAIGKAYSNDQLLKFSVLIPKDFTEKPAKQLKNKLKNDRIYGEIFYAYGPPIQDVRPSISVQSVELQRHISAKDWFLSRALQLGYTIRGIETDALGDQYDAFYIRLDPNGKTEIVRTKGFLHQNRLVFIEYAVPQIIWQNDRDKQINAINSFKFMNDYPINIPEEMVNYAYLDSFYTEFPKNWVLTKNKSDEVNRLDLAMKTADENGFVFAEIDVKVVSTRSLKDRLDKTIYPVNIPVILKNVTSAITEKNLKSDPVLERHEINLNFESDLNLTEVYPLRRKQSETYVTHKEHPISKELWVTVIKTPNTIGKSYIVTMTTPHRDLNMYQWALARKTYEYLIQSIR